jgi:hypothetical protein
MNFPKLLMLLLAAFPTLSVATVCGANAVSQRVVEQYEFDPEQYESDARKASRWLTGVSLVGSNGKVAERWDFTNDSSGASYRRYVYTYDRNRRTTAELVYESNKTVPRQYFSVSRSRSSVRILPVITDTLSSVTINRYDRRGNLIESRITDADGKLKQRTTRTFNAHGKLISLTNENGDGSIECKQSRTYSENYTKSVTSFENCISTDVLRIDSKYDQSGRSGQEEQFSKPLNSEGSPVRTSLSTRRYSGDVTNLEWLIWNRSGQPTKKLLIVDKGDYEISRKEFVPASNHADGKSSWLLSEEETREYEFDKLGNLVKEIWRKRQATDKTFRVSYVVENVVTSF